MSSGRDLDELHRGLGEQLGRGLAFAPDRGVGAAQAPPPPQPRRRAAAAATHLPKRVRDVLLFEAFVPRFRPVTYPLKVRLVDVLLNIPNCNAPVSVP